MHNLADSEKPTRAELLAAAHESRRREDERPPTAKERAIRATYEAERAKVRQERDDRMAAGTWAESDEDRFVDNEGTAYLDELYSGPGPDDWLGFRHLRDFARQMFAGTIIRRDAPTADSRLLYHHTGRRDFDDRWIEYEPRAHHWVLLRDNDQRKGRVPRSIRTPQDLRAWVDCWREGHRALLGRELAVLAVPGHQVHFAIWHHESVLDEAARDVAREWVGGADEPRFVPLPSPYTLPEYSDTWYEDKHRGRLIYLPPPAVATRSLPTAASRAPTPGSVDKLVTGIPAIDSLPFGAPGIERNRVLVLAGAKGSGKSSLAFEVAETALATGDCVLWAAHDERPEQIDARRLVRRGCSHTVAERRDPEDLAKLDGLPFWVIGKTDELEASWEIAHECALESGRQLVVVIDSLQTATIAALGELRGQRDRIDAALSAIGTCQAQWPATVIVTSEATRDGEAKGSTGIGHAADFELALRCSGDTVQAKVVKWRAGRTGVTVALTLDKLHQRLIDPAAPTKAPKPDRGGDLRGRILAAVPDLGDKATGRGITDAVTGKATTIRAELRAMVADGALLLEGGVYRLP